MTRVNQQVSAMREVLVETYYRHGYYQHFTNEYTEALSLVKAMVFPAVMSGCDSWRHSMSAYRVNEYADGSDIKILWDLHWVLFI